MKYPIRITADGFHQHRNDPKRSSIQGTHVTFENGVAHCLSTAHVTQVLETKGSDLSMTNYNSVLTKSAQQYDFTFAELFAGIGGVSFGFEAVGGKCVLAAEYDPMAENPDGTSKRQFAQDAYKTLHHGTPVVGDVFKLDAADVPDHDVLSFTTPCQSFSVAGKRLGFEDTRGTLVFEALRIANAKRPKALFMENVKGLVNHDKGRTLDTILHAMNEIGYTVDFNVLNSKYFGVPQNRERVFIIAIRDDLVEPSEWTPEGNTMLPKAKRRLKEAGLRTFNFDWPSQNSVDCRLRDVLEAEVDPKYYLAEDKTVKLVAELRDREISIIAKRHLDDINPIINPGFVTKNMNGSRIKESDEPMHCLTVNDVHGVIEGVPIRESIRIVTVKDDQDGVRYKKGEVFDVVRFTGDDGEIAVVQRPDGRVVPVCDWDYKVLDGLLIREATSQGYAIAREGDAVNIAFPSSKTRRGRVGEQMANTLEASGCNQGVVERHAEVKRVGNVNPSGRGMNGTVYDIDAGLSPTLTTNKGEGTKMLEEILPTITPFREERRQNGPRFKSDGSEAHTITAVDRHGVAIGEYPQYRIRKLTPRECMRLQGFPESATDRLYAEGFSDSRVYKFAGNAVTTTVIKALAERLAPQINAKGAI